MLFDDVLQITWMQNANLVGVTDPFTSGFNWGSANAMTRDLVYAGYDDWRLPLSSVSSRPGIGVLVDCHTSSELQCRDNELAYMYYYNLPGASGTKKMGDQTAVGGALVVDVKQMY